MTDHPEQQPAPPADSVQIASARLAAMLRDDPHRLRRRSVSLGVPIDDADVATYDDDHVWRYVIDNPFGTAWTTPGGPAHDPGRPVLCSAENDRFWHLTGQD